MTSLDLAPACGRSDLWRSLQVCYVRDVDGKWFVLATEDSGTRPEFRIGN